MGYIILTRIFDCVQAFHDADFTQSNTINAHESFDLLSNRTSCFCFLHTEYMLKLICNQLIVPVFLYWLYLTAKRLPSPSYMFIQGYFPWIVKASLSQVVFSCNSFNLKECCPLHSGQNECMGVGGVKVGIVAFQAIDPGSIPGWRKFFKLNSLLQLLPVHIDISKWAGSHCLLVLLCHKTCHSKIIGSPSRQPRWLQISHSVDNHRKNELRWSLNSAHRIL